jgi:hypothetical protein
VTTRRVFLGLLAVAPFFAGARSDAREAVLPRLIKDAREHGDIGQRIDFISRALLGTRYQAHTLIGGPRRKEQFVLRDDAFDCVTYCEAVLAAAMADDFTDYPAILRRIRYAQGEVRWAERNHDFAQWSRRIVDKNLCRPVEIAALQYRGNRHVGFDGRPQGAAGRRHHRLRLAPRRARLLPHRLHRLQSARRAPAPPCLAKPWQGGE